MFGLYKKKKNNEIKITGTFSYIDVEIDNKLIRLPGEMGEGYFLCYDECIKEWTKQKGKSITKNEKENLITRINEKQKNSSMKILFRDNKKNKSLKNIESEKDKISDLIYCGIKTFMLEKKDLFTKENLYVISYSIEKNNYTKPYSSFLYFNTEEHYQKQILNKDEDMFIYYRYNEYEWEESANGTDKYFIELSNLLYSLSETIEIDIRTIFQYAIDAFIRLKKDMIVSDKVELILNARNSFEESELIDAYIKVNNPQGNCDYINKIEEFY